jgi:hypothetical protein
MMNVETYADRVLRPHTSGAGEQRGLSQYIPVNHGQLPSCWTELAEAAPSEPIIGVFENMGWPQRPRIIVTRTALVVVRSDGSTRIPYREIRSFEPLSKDPIAEELVLELDSGVRERVPIVGEEEGAIFTFLRFLVDARRAIRSG